MKTNRFWMGLSVSLVMTSFLLGLSGCAPQASSEGSVPSFSEFQSSPAEVLAIKTTIPAQDPPCAKSCKTIRQEFRYVVYVGKQIYAYWDEKQAETQTNFDTLATTLEASITDQTTATQYYRTLRRWAAAFHDGHVNAMMDPTNTDMEIYTAAIRLEALSPGSDHEKVIITKINDSTLDAKVGDVVLSINGMPTSQALDLGEKEASGSTRRMRRNSATRRVVDALGAEESAFLLSLELQRGDKTVSVQVPRSIQLTEAPYVMPATKEDTGVNLIQAQILPGGLGYLRIDGFSGSQSYFLLKQAMSRLFQTQGLLIDLRKNGGGDQSGNEILSRLIKTPITRYRVSSVMDGFLISQRPELFLSPWTAGTRFSDWENLTVEPYSGTNIYEKPVVALTGPGCFSACDTFTSALKSNGLAQILGEGTGGGTGSPLVFELPLSKHSFRYSVVRGRTAKGDAIEGFGTLPDLEILPTVEERVAGKDLQLTKAFDVLKSKVASASQKATEPTQAPAAVVGTKDLSPVWEQDLQLAPTLSEERALRALAPRDERD